MVSYINLIIFKVTTVCLPFIYTFGTINNNNVYIIVNMQNVKNTK